MSRRILIPIFILMALLSGACGVSVNLNIDRGSGNVITEKRSVSGFDQLVLSGIGDVDLTQGSSDSLEIEAEDNIIPYIKTEVSGGVLRISFERKSIFPTKPIKFHLTMRDIHVLDTQGVSNVTAKQIKTDQLRVNISGTGSVNMNELTANQLMLNVSGAGSFTSGGVVADQKIVMSGAGNYNGEDIQSKTADITISGLGRAVCWVTDNLNVTISGTGGVDYYGSPEVSQHISGIGQLKHAGNK